MNHITRYSVMPIAPVEAHTEYFEAGAVTIGVEYRLLTDAIAAATDLEGATGNDRGQTENLDDRGVAFASRDLADEYGFRDVDGRLPVGPIHDRGQPRAED